MQHGEDTFAGQGGVDIYYQWWWPDGRPSGSPSGRPLGGPVTTAGGTAAGPEGGPAGAAAESPRAALVIVPGLGEHSGRHMNLVEAMSQRGLALYAQDLRGHGRSHGRHGYIGHWSEIRHDLEKFLDLVRTEVAGAPVFLYGQSLGGLVVLDYALRHPPWLAGLITSSPAIGDNGLPPVRQALARLLDRVWPGLTMSSGLDSNDLSRDRAVVDAYDADPLVHRWGTPRLAMQTFKTIDWVQDHAGDLQTPLLLMHGSSDGIVDPEGSRRFARHAGGELVTFIEYEGGYHEIFNDIIKEQVLADTVDWLEARLAAS